MKVRRRPSVTNETIEIRQVLQDIVCWNERIAECETRREMGPGSETGDRRPVHDLDLFSDEREFSHSFFSRRSKF